MSDGETRVDGRKKKMERRNVRQMERKLSQSNGIFHRICLKSDVSSDAQDPRKHAVGFRTFYLVPPWGKVSG